MCFRVPIGRLHRFFFGRLLFAIVSGGFATALVACSGDTVPPGRVLIRNDILDKEHNSYVIDQVVTSAGLMPFRMTLKPMQKVLLPYKEIKSLRFARAYQDYTAVYEVRCPGKPDQAGFLLKLIDIHLNRMSGGCQLKRKGKTSHGKTEWDE